MPDTLPTSETQPNPPSAPAVEADAATQASDPKQALLDQIIAALKTCYDPEIPVDIWELGLIYRIDIRDDNAVEIDMTLTSPMCPVAGELPPYVKGRVEDIEAVSSCNLQIVWEPPWNPDMMSEAAKLELDMF
jgi:FeS assembly SUF system protein